MELKAHEIAPFYSIGGIVFTDCREVVRKKINGNFMHGVYKVGTLIELYDYFTESDIKVLYNANEEVGAIEFYSGDVRFLGKNLFMHSYVELEHFFQNIDNDLELSDMGFTSYAFGIGIEYDELRNAPISVIVFKRDYYG